MKTVEIPNNLLISDDILTDVFVRDLIMSSCWWLHHCNNNFIRWFQVTITDGSASLSWSSWHMGLCGGHVRTKLAQLGILKIFIFGHSCVGLQLLRVSCVGVTAEFHLWHASFVRNCRGVTQTKHWLQIDHLMSSDNLSPAFHSAPYILPKQHSQATVLMRLFITPNE